MTTRTGEDIAALIAMLHVRPADLSWHDIVERVLSEGSACAVWDELLSDALLPDPAVHEAMLSAKQEADEWAARGLEFVTVFDERYPRPLLEVRETPPILFYQGDLRAEDTGMSVVGSRKMTAMGARIARAAAEMLVDKELTVIAGLAEGIDTVAHESALARGGRTVAVIGTGIERYYPAKNRALQERIARDGLVISQFWPDASPTKSSFPMRNAVMSGYGMATIIVEAGEMSGTRIQARNAVAHGRPVILTETVAGNTSWGRKLIGRPGVRVIAGIHDLADAIDEIVNFRSTVESTMQNVIAQVSR